MSVDDAPRRIFTVLPDEDLNEAYCPAHDRSMMEVVPLVSRDGASYGLTEEYHAFFCPECVARAVANARALEGMGDRLPSSPREANGVIIRVFAKKVFERWDDGNAASDQFTLIRDWGDDTTGVNLFAPGTDLSHSVLYRTGRQGGDSE